MMFNFESYILFKYDGDEYCAINVFSNLNEAEDYILAQSAPFDFQIQCLTPGKPSLFITYEMEC